MNQITLSSEIVTAANETVKLLTTDYKFQVMADTAQHERYLKDARKMLDEHSKHFNGLGLDRLIAAIIIEFVGNGYTGKHNED